MINRYKKLSYSLKWLSFESILYHAIFIIHQIFLFKIAGLKTYGAIGVTFSIIYLVVTISSFGLESSLSPFFNMITKNKKVFKAFFITQITPTIALSALSVPILIILQNKQRYIFSQPISSLFIGIISLIILSESIKKIARGLLYMTFKNKTNMFIEISSLLFYVSSVWIGYYITKKITINLIFIPMCITSFLSSFALIIYVYKFYLKLPNSSFFQNEKSITYRIFKTRAINFMNQFTHNMFSSNFLVPFFALQFGLAQAGVFKLLSHISYTITMLMRKIFGWSTDAMLSQTKNLDLKHKQNIFHAITQKINTIILALVIFLSINLTKIIKYTNTPQTVLNWPLIYFFLAISLTESLFISYEKFYIAEEKNIIIFLLNIFSIVSLSIILFYSSILSQKMLLSLIAITRATCFILLALISFYSWRIKPKVHIKIIYLFSFFLSSLILFIIL